MKRTGPPKRRTELARPTKPMERGAMKKVNRARKKRLRAAQFGTDGYREHILAMRCLVTGDWPVDPAHVLKSRGAGGGPEGMAPLSREVHDAFDDMGAEQFRRRYGKTKAWVRAQTRRIRKDWEARLG